VSLPLAWAARYNTWLLIKLTPKGVVFSFLIGGGGNQLSSAYLQGYALRKVGQLSEKRHQVWQPVGLLSKAFAQEGQLLGVGVIQLEEEEQLIPLNGMQALGLGRLLQVEPHLALVALPPKPTSCWLLQASLPVYVVTVCVT